jgi:hypothetical protein
MSIVVGFNGPEFRDPPWPRRSEILVQPVTQQDVERAELALLMPKNTYDVEVALVQRTTRDGPGHNRPRLSQDSITAAEFSRLKPGMWLGSSVIETMMGYINQLEWYTGVTHRQAFRTAAIGPLTVQKDGLKLVSDIKPLYVIFVVNTIPPAVGGGNHWVSYLAAYDHGRRTFRLTLYDSLGVHTAQNAYVSAKCSSLFDVDYRRDGNVQNGVCPQQPNAFDCGIYAIANSMYLYANPTAPVAFESTLAVRFRYWVVNKIVEEDARIQRGVAAVHPRPREVIVIE